jgi:hypothetical protein
MCARHGRDVRHGYLLHRSSFNLFGGIIIKSGALHANTIQILPGQKIWKLALYAYFVAFVVDIVCQDAKYIAHFDQP